MSERRDMEVLAAGVHGALFLGHGLGYYYNRQRGNRGWQAFHAGAALLDAYALYVHWRAARAQA